MKFYKELLVGKGWIFYGSLVGGVLGALVMYLNVLVSRHHELFVSLSIGSKTVIVLGMIGGLIGGPIGSFVSGAFVRDEVIFNIGASLGFGVINGFLSGTITGIALGVVQKQYPDLVSLSSLFIIIPIIILIAIAIFFFRKKLR